MTSLEQIAYLKGRIAELEKQIAELKFQLLAERVKPKGFSPNEPLYIECGADNTGGPLPRKAIFIS